MPSHPPGTRDTVRGARSSPRRSTPWAPPDARGSFPRPSGRARRGTWFAPWRPDGSPPPVGREDVHVRHRPQHVREWLRKRPERRDHALAGVGPAGVGHRRHDHEPPVVLLRHERQRWGAHHVRDRRQLVGAASASATNPAGTSGVAGRSSMPPRIRSSSMEAGVSLVADSEVAAAATDRPVQVGVALGVGAQDLAVGCHHVGRHEVVDGEAVPRARKPTPPPRVMPPIPTERMSPNPSPVRTWRRRP